MVSGPVGGERGSQGLVGSELALELRGSYPPLPSAPLPPPGAHHSMQLEGLPGRHRHRVQARLEGLHIGAGSPETQQVEVSLEGPVHG